MAQPGNVVVGVKVTGLAEAFRTLAKGHRQLAELATTNAVLLERAAAEMQQAEDSELEPPGNDGHQA